MPLHCIARPFLTDYITSILVSLSLSLYLHLYTTILQFIIPDEGVKAGRSFGYGATSPLNSQWELVENTVFDLGINGDQLLVYCLDADNKPNFLWGFSYNGDWSEPGLADYGTNMSALPDSLAKLGHTTLPHKDNCLYNGTQSGRKTDLQASFMNVSNWDCTDDARFEIDMSTSGVAGGMRLDVIMTVLTMVGASLLWV
jgi:hypothetical protein